MVLAVLLIAALSPLAAQDLAQRAQAKLDKFSNNEYKPHEIVDFSAQEIDAWVATKAPEGFRDAHVQIAAGTMSASARVDFLKMRHAKGEATNPLIARMIEGERPLKISVRLVSSGGRCTVYLTRVELSGIVLEGSLLDFLIQNFFVPLYPDAKINQPFDLDFNIDRLEARPQALRVVLK